MEQAMKKAYRVNEAQIADKPQRIENIDGMDNPGKNRANKSQKMQTEQTRHKQQMSHRECRRSVPQKMQIKQAMEDSVKLNKAQIADKPQKIKNVNKVDKLD